jgi:hypothetical protein
LNDLVAVFLVAALAASLMQWRDFNASEQKPEYSQQKQKEKERIQCVTAQMAQRIPQDEAGSELQYSGWAFLALGSGAVRTQNSRIQLAHKGVRVMQRADCPSEACLPIRSIQWLLVVPRDARMGTSGKLEAAEVAFPTRATQRSIPATKRAG